MDDESRAPRAPRRPRRWIGFTGALGLAGLVVFLTWRVTSLRGLPDVGDPFDVAAFADIGVPDDRNAFILYRQAVARMAPMPPGATADWATATDADRRWLAENRAALDLWKRGTGRPDALNIPPRDWKIDTILKTSRELRDLGRLGMMEGARLEAEGDVAGAYSWYLAVLRSSRHVGRRGGMMERLVGIALYQFASKGIGRWAARPEVDAAMLRRALDDAVAVDAMTPPTSDMIKCEYFFFNNSVDDPRLPDLVGPAPAASGRPWDDAFWRGYEAFRRDIRREPERSRRVFRLVLANWLAYCDRPPGLRPPMAVPGPTFVGDHRARAFLPELYAIDATATDSARALSPEDLARWFASATDAPICLPSFGAAGKALARERTARAQLLVTLANGLHQRDHGEYPETVDELVGAYLESVPDGFVRPD